MYLIVGTEGYFGVGLRSSSARGPIQNRTQIQIQKIKDFDSPLCVIDACLVVWQASDDDVIQVEPIARHPMHYEATPNIGDDG